MRRKRVISTNLASVGYESKQQILEVRFANSSIYRYYDVEKDVHEGLMNAKSKGEYFAENIKYRYFFRKVQEAK